MDRECCLSLLITLVGGATLLACGWWPAAHRHSSSARTLEKITWRQIWLPVAPALTVAIVLCGWAFAEPNPVPEKMPGALLLISMPFALLFMRAAVRSGWALMGNQGELAAATVGLLWPRIVFSPYLAKKLHDRQIEAALEHERAHARHRDPLRIWLAQLATDLQWPWPQACERLHQWLTTLELARDEEARTAGIDGPDLAEAILASARFNGYAGFSMQAALIREPFMLQERIWRLLDPSPVIQEKRQAPPSGLLYLLVPTVTVAFAGGVIYGERLVRALFWITALI